MYFNETINVDTVAQLNTSLPVEIDIAQTPLAGYLKQAKLDIAELERRERATSSLVGFAQYAIRDYHAEPAHVLIAEAAAGARDRAMSQRRRWIFIKAAFVMV